MRSLIRFGGLFFVDSSPAFVIDGDEIVFMEVGDAGQLLLTMDIYDENRQHVSKLRRNAWVFNNGGYVITTHPSNLSLSPGAIMVPHEGMTWITASVSDRRTIDVEGQFYTRLGRRITIAPNYVLVDARNSIVPEPRQESVTLADGHIFENCDRAAIIFEQNSFELNPGSGTYRGGTM